MKESRQITEELLSLSLTGFKVEDLFSKEFISELKKDMPTAVIGHIGIRFTDSANALSVSHDVRNGKIMTERVDVEAYVPKLAPRLAQVIKKVFA
jgi:hypothetical protein